MRRTIERERLCPRVNERANCHREVHGRPEAVAGRD